MKKNLTLLFMLLVSLVVNAQSNIWINGYTYTEVDGKQIMVPFATICVYDCPATEQIKYFMVSGPNGFYNINPYEYVKPHHFVVSAPGYKTKEFNIHDIEESIDGKKVQGNISVNIKLDKLSESKDSISKKITYTLAKLKLRGKAKNMLEALNLIPEIKKDNNDWVEKSSGKSVCFFLNGMFVTTDVYSQLSNYPIDLIDNVECYQLPDGVSYAMGVNINLTVGNPCKVPDYMLEESYLMF